MPVIYEGVQYPDFIAFGTDAIDFGIQAASGPNDPVSVLTWQIGVTDVDAAAELCREARAELTAPAAPGAAPQPAPRASLASDGPGPQSHTPRQAAVGSQAAQQTDHVWNQAHRLPQRGLVRTDCPQRREQRQPQQQHPCGHGDQGVPPPALHPGLHSGEARRPRS